MLVKGLVRNVQDRGNADKQFCVVDIEFSNPLEIIQVRLFQNSYQDGTVHTLKQCIGVELDLPIEAQIYQNKLQYGMPFGESIKLPAPKPAAQPRAAKAS